MLIGYQTGSSVTLPIVYKYVHNTGALREKRRCHHANDLFKLKKKTTTRINIHLDFKRFNSTQLNYFNTAKNSKITKKNQITKSFAPNIDNID